jgi:hypothetical protein
MRVCLKRTFTPPLPPTVFDGSLNYDIFHSVISAGRGETTLSTDCIPSAATSLVEGKGQESL